jgi:hypothetical protein
MAKSNGGMVHGPSTPIATMPKSYKSSTSKQYDGVSKGPAGQYPRTKSSNAVPEVTIDSTVGGKGD